tara:strand:+ start:26 stop:1693 length:1668 start_codon:yes stop_codon:yes gene_type:complete
MEPEKEELRGSLTRQIAGTGYEIGAGLAFDALTAPLAWTGPVYAAANFGEGAFSNIVGQLIRGEKFNWSEVASSGALGMVPLSQLRLGKKATNIVGDVNTYRRAIGSGAVTGVADQTIQAGLGEQRLPTTGEVVGGALTGGVVGGGIQGTAVLGKRLLKQIYEKAPVVHAMSDIPQQQRIIFSLGGIRDGKLDVDQLRASGYIGASTGRYTLETWQTRSDQYVPDFFKRAQRRELPGFLEEYGEYLQEVKGLSSEDILSLKAGHNISYHHITPLKAGVDLYHGTRYQDDEWFAVTNVFNEFGLFPGAPATDVRGLRNFMYVLEEPHNLLHHQFLKDNIGLQGEVFFTAERKALLRGSKEGRIQVAREYAAIIKRGKDLIEDMMDQFQIAFGKTNPNPEKLVEILQRSLDDGSIPLLEPGYTLNSKNRIANKIKEVSDLVKRQYDAEFIEPIRRADAAAELEIDTRNRELIERARLEDEKFDRLKQDVDKLAEEFIASQKIFTRFSDMIDAREKAEQIINSRMAKSGQLQLLFDEGITFEAAVERLARKLFERERK